MENHSSIYFVIYFMNTGTEVHPDKVWEQLGCIKKGSQIAITKHMHIILAVNAIYTVFMRIIKLSSH